MNDLKVLSHTIVFQEVPNEVSLALNISGCPHHCEGCHSPELAEDVGVELLPELKKLVAEYKPFITCVCFMGGDQNLGQLKDAIKIVRAEGLHTAIYTGLDSLDPFIKSFKDDDQEIELTDYIDFLKIGHYDKSLGGLSSPTTNQKMYCFIGETEDITWWFQRKKENG